MQNSSGYTAAKSPLNRRPQPIPLTQPEVIAPRRGRPPKAPESETTSPSATTSKAQTGAEMRSREIAEGQAKEQAAQTFTPTTLEQVWGQNGTEKYGTLDAEIYENKIKNMDRAEIFYHASQYSIIPTDNLMSLRKKLMVEFNKHVAKFSMPNKNTVIIGTLPKGYRQSFTKKPTEFKDLED